MYISISQKLSENFINEFKDKICWHSLELNSKLNLSFDFVINNQDKFNFEFIKSIAEKFNKKIKLSEITETI